MSLFSAETYAELNRWLREYVPSWERKKPKPVVPVIDYDEMKRLGEEFLQFITDPKLRALKSAELDWHIERSKAMLERFSR